jgi:hypothetical protein
MTSSFNGRIQDYQILEIRLSFIKKIKDFLSFADHLILLRVKFFIPKAFAFRSITFQDAFQFDPLTFLDSFRAHLPKIHSLLQKFS